MNPTYLSKRTLPLIAAAILAAAASVPARAVDCAAPKGVEERGGCAAAKQGPVALRHYVERTRMIHSLYYYDYAPYAQRTGLARDADAATKVAIAK